MPKARILKIPPQFFEPIDNETVAGSVINQIETLILNGILREGVRLPSERDLSEQFSISRPKVREALQILEERQLVRVIHGDGIYIGKLGAEAMSPALIELYKRHPSAIFDHLEYRREQECFAARLAAVRSTKTDRALINNLLDAMKNAHNKGNHKLGDELDTKFHNAVVSASHNRILIHMMSSLYELNRSAVFFSRREILNIAEVSEFLLDQHHAIGEAICSSQTNKAVEAAGDHIDYVILSTQEALSERERETIAAKRVVVV